MSYDPDHMNQFYRNPPESTIRWGPTVWPDGTAVNYSGGNCWATVAAMVFRWLMQGDFTHPRAPNGFECTGIEAPTPPRVRYWSGQRASAGHVTDAVKAAKHWDVEVVTLFGLSLAEMTHRVQDLKQLVSVGTDYEYIKDLWSCAATFDGGHQLLVREVAVHDFEGRGGVHKVQAVRVSDPLCDYMKWVPWGQFVKACEAYSGSPGHATAYTGRTQEATMALYNYKRNQYADVKKGTVLRNEPDGTGVVTLGGAVNDLPVVGLTRDGEHVALGVTKANGKDVNRPLWVKRSDITNISTILPLDEDAVRAEERTKAAAALGPALEKARAEEQAKLATIVATRTQDLQNQAQASRAAWEAMKTKVVTRLKAADVDADRFLADIEDDLIPIGKA